MKNETIQVAEVFLVPGSNLPYNILSKYKLTIFDKHFNFAVLTYA